MSNRFETTNLQKLLPLIYTVNCITADKEGACEHLASIFKDKYGTVVSANSTAMIGEMIEAIAKNKDYCRVNSHYFESDLLIINMHDEDILKDAYQNLLLKIFAVRRYLKGYTVIVSENKLISLFKNPGLEYYVSIYEPIDKEV